MKSKIEKISKMRFKKCKPMRFFGLDNTYYLYIKNRRLAVKPEYAKGFNAAISEVLKILKESDNEA